MITDRAVLRSNWNCPRRLGLSFAAALVCAALVFPGAALADDPKPAQPDPQTQPTTNKPASEPAFSERIEAVIAAARAYVGVPYRVGTEGPDTTDCSGLVFRAFANAGEVGQVGGSRLRAAGYLRWFAQHDMLTTDVEDAERGDLVIYGSGEHIGIYLGDGRVISALVTGVTVHSLAGITIPPTAFLAVDWNGKRGPFKPGHIVLPTVLETPEAPAALVPATEWLPALDDEAAMGPAIAGKERVDLRTANSRTFEDKTGRLTTEVFTRPINYLPDGSTEWQPIDLRFQRADKNADGAVSEHAPVAVTVNEAASDDALIAAASGDSTVAIDPLKVAKDAPDMELGEEGRHADYRDLLANGAGLRVFPRADGFKAFVVLANRPGSRTFSFKLDAAGLTPVLEEDGSVTLRDEADAVVGRITRPMLLDSSDIDGDGGGVRPGAVAVRLEDNEDEPDVLTLTVDKTALEEAVYPAYVDLTVVDFPSADGSAQHTFASSFHHAANFSAYQRPEAPGYSELWHGRRPDRKDDNEAYLRFPGLSGLLTGATVESAELAAFPYWQNDSKSASSSFLGRVTEDWNVRTLNWDLRPAAELAEDAVETTQGTWSDLDVSTYVQDITAGAEEDFGLVLHADAAARGHWKRFVAETTDGSGALEPRLVIHWSNLRPVAQATTAAVDGNVTLSWANASIAPAPSRVEIQLSTDDFATVAQKLRLKGRNAVANTLTLATDEMAAGTYSWRVRAEYGDAIEWSAWSDVGTFGLNTRVEDVVARPQVDATGVDLAGSDAERAATDGPTLTEQPELP